MINDTFALMFSRLSADNQRLVLDLLQRLQPDSTAQLTADLRPYIPQWKQHLSAAGLSPKTIRQYGVHVSGLLEQFPNPHRHDIESYISLCRARNLSGASLHSKYAAWQRFFDWCIEHSLILDNPMKDIQRIRTPYNHRYPPETEDIRKLFQLALSLRDRALLTLLVDCGLRLGEVCDLLLCNVSRSSVKVYGKGSKWRSVPVSAACRRTLDTYIDTLSPDSVYLFPGRFRDRGLSPRYIEERLEDLSARAGIKKITPHQLRHYCASQLLNNGANLKSVSQILGHSSTTITTDVYWHTDEQTNQRTLEAHSPMTNIERLINAPSLF